MRLTTFGFALCLSLGLSLANAAVGQTYDLRGIHRDYDWEVRGCTAGLFRRGHLVERFHVRAGARHPRAARERACEQAIQRCRDALYHRRAHRPRRGHCEVLR